MYFAAPSLLHRRSLQALQLLLSVQGKSHEVFLRMKQIFVGLKMAFAELSSDSKARVLFTKQISERGGSVMVPRPGVFFGKKGAACQ